MPRRIEPNTWQVPDLPERYLFDLRTECNLKCPMCLLHGLPEEEKKTATMGVMDVDKSRRVLDEIIAAKPLIQPSMWGEPLLARDLRTHLANMKERGIAVSMNTNGLTLTEPLAEFFVEIALDSVFFSIDSTTPETLKKVRGIDRLDKIVRNLEMLLDVRARMGSNLPRIGATFTVQDDNEHELDAFIDHWVHKVDVVRVGAVFEDGKLTGIGVPEHRVPCGALYHTMPIHYNGDVSMCCFDSFGTEVMGNVFRDGVEGVWKGERFSEVRRLHEAGRWDEVPFCRDCNAWTGYLYEEEIAQRNGVDVLVRRSPQFVYYNRIDRLDSWGDNLRGHATPDRDRLLKAASGGGT